MLKCSKCNKVMEDKQGTKVIGFKLTIDLNSTVVSSSRGLWLKNLGNYADLLFAEGDSLKLELNLCYECWLNGLLHGNGIEELK